MIKLFRVVTFRSIYMIIIVILLGWVGYINKYAEYNCLPKLENYNKQCTWMCAYKDINICNKGSVHDEL